MRVYLTGPITGHSDETIRSWRAYATQCLAPIAEVIDPASASYDSYAAFEKHETVPQSLDRLQHGLFVTRRNRNLIRSSDVILANFLATGHKASIGSIGEIYWADAFGKPVIVVREPSGNVHDHAMINAIASRVVFTLEESFAVIQEIAAITNSQMQTA